MTKFAKELYEEYTITTREAREDMLDDLHDALGEMIQENERLRAALKRIASLDVVRLDRYVQELAREALGE